MIIGTGVDIIEIERIQKAIDRWGESFLKHVFNEEEIEFAVTPYMKVIDILSSMQKSR